MKSTLYCRIWFLELGCKFDTVVHHEVLDTFVSLTADAVKRLQHADIACCRGHDCDQRVFARHSKTPRTSSC